MLLSPAAPSFNRYLDYRELSEHFRAIVAPLAESSGHDEPSTADRRSTRTSSPTFDVTDWSATETDDGVDVALRYRLGEIDFVEHLAHRRAGADAGAVS